MFQAIAPYQAKVVAALEDDLRKGTFPRASLFSGQRYSLRMTTALETARILSCSQGGDDRCSCPSCVRFRSLSTDQCVIMSQRDDQSIVETAIALFEKNKTDFSKQFLLKSIRIALMQYHGSLLDAASSKDKGTFDAAGAVSDILLEIEGAKEMTDREFKKKINDLRSSVKKLQTLEKKDKRLTIAQVRAITDWAAHTSVDGARKFVILEGVEDVNVAVRNSLLKTLEEPPEGVYFLLLSSHPARILPTILSRVRHYRFEPLTQKMVDSLLSSYYPTRPVNSFEHLFLSESGVDIASLSSSAKALLASSESGVPLPVKESDALFSALTSDTCVNFLVAELLKETESAFLSGAITEGEARRIAGLVNTIKSQGDLFNQNGKLMVQTMYLRLLGGKA